MFHVIQNLAVTQGRSRSFKITPFSNSETTEVRCTVTIED